MLKQIENIKNNIDFFIRNTFKVSRKSFCVPNEPKDVMFNQLPQEKVETAQKLEHALFCKYKLEHLKNNSSVRNYLENLYIIELLEQSFSFNKISTPSILDIGSKNWFYAQGEHAFFAHNCKDFSLTGIELDAFRVYTSFYSRYDAANFYIKGLKNTEYIAGNLLNHNHKYDYITWFFPFITATPLLKWGLPLKFYKPKEMLSHAYNLLNKNGQMLIVNQGKEEYKIQLQLLQELGITYQPKGKINSCILEHEHERYYIVVTKTKN